MVSPGRPPAVAAYGRTEKGRLAGKHCFSAAVAASQKLSILGPKKVVSPGRPAYGRAEMGFEPAASIFVFGVG